VCFCVFYFDGIVVPIVTYTRHHLFACNNAAVRGGKRPLPLFRRNKKDNGIYAVTRGCRAGHNCNRQRTVIGSRPGFRPTFHQHGVNNSNIIHVKLSTSVGVGRLCVAKRNVYCIHVRSVKNKVVSVSELVISRDIDILALTETWLGSAIDGHVISTLVPCGYEFHSVSRPHGTRGGGVAVLYKSGLTVKPIPMRDNYTNFEHSDYYVTIRAVTFRLCVVYRRRHRSETVFLTPFSLTSGLRF